MIYQEFDLSKNYIARNGKEAQKTMDQINELLKGKAEFCFCKNECNHDALLVIVHDEKLQSKAGRPVGHTFDYQAVEQMRAAGMTHKEIYTTLGYSKALYYLRLKEYKNNNLDNEK